MKRSFSANCTLQAEAFPSYNVADGSLGVTLTSQGNLARCTYRNPGPIYEGELTAGVVVLAEIPEGFHPDRPLHPQLPPGKRGGLSVSGARLAGAALATGYSLRAIARAADNPICPWM